VEKRVVLKLEDFLLCPNCKGKLEEFNSTMQCNLCSSPLKYESEALILEKENTYYWGEIQRLEMARILSSAIKKNWREAVDEILLKEHPDLSNMVLGGDRVDWIHPTKRSNLTVLDVGSGWGQTSFLLAKDRTNNVISLEKIKDRALFQGLRKKQDEVDNIYIVNGSFFDTQFRESSFDLVLFIGVLEWVGLEGQEENPSELQLKALRKAHSLLKNGGKVTIGIENRIGFNNFLGAKDHSGLKFTSLMPRIIADAYMKIRKPAYRSNKKSSSYRTYTYTLWGYKTLIKEAGFKEIEFFIAHPHYANPRCLMELNNRAIGDFFARIYQPSSLKDILFSFIFQALSCVKIAHLFAPHFIIFAKK
jgi:ubiquinone/menaquinone biosynthesis C-methylase UbiE